MFKKISFIFLLLLVSISTAVCADDSDDIAYDLLIKLIPQNFESVYANIFDFEPDEQEELWGIVRESTNDGVSSSKIYVFKNLKDEYPLIWKSEDIRGVMVDHGIFRSDQQRHIWLDIFRSDLKLHQIWIFRWDGANTQKVYPYDNAKNEIFSEQFFGWHRDENGEFEIKAILNSQNKVIVYVLRNGKMVVKREELIKPLINVSNENQKPIEEKYPAIAKLLGRYYSSYKLMEVENIDFEKKIYMCKVENKTNEKDKKLIITETSDSVKKIWYELPNEYVGYLFDAYEVKDLNHDEYKEIFFYDAYGQEYPGVYILSIKPNCFDLVSLTDENGTTIVFMYGPIDFEDFNKDGYTDIMIDSITEPTYWYWNEQQKQFELK